MHCFLLFSFFSFLVYISVCCCNRNSEIHFVVPIVAVVQPTIIKALMDEIVNSSPVIVASSSSSDAAAAITSCYSNLAGDVPAEYILTLLLLLLLNATITSLSAQEGNSMIGGIKKSKYGVDIVG